MNESQFQIVFAQLEESMKGESEKYEEDLAEIEELRRLADAIREATSPDLIFSSGS